MSITAIPTAMLENLPPEMQNFQPLTVICNILPEEPGKPGIMLFEGNYCIPVIQTYGVYYVAAPTGKERFKTTRVKWAPLYMDKGDSVFNIVSGPKGSGNSQINDNRIRMLQGSREIAEDLCQQLNQSDGPTGFWGKFVCAGLEPTEEELVAAEKKLRDYFLHVVAVADRVWSATARHDMIDSRCKVAARHLNITDKPWIADVKAMQECPACMEPIRQGARLCRFCGTILGKNGAFTMPESVGPIAEPSPLDLVQSIDDPLPKRARKAKASE